MLANTVRDVKNSSDVISYNTNVTEKYSIVSFGYAQVSIFITMATNAYQLTGVLIIFSKAHSG